MIDQTHSPDLACWVEGADTHGDFPVQNLPLCIFSAAGAPPRAGTRIADHLLDLAALADAGIIPMPSAELAQPSLNALLAQSAETRRALRHTLSAILTSPAQAPAIRPHLHPVESATLHLPTRIGDYTDFYAGIHHAENIGRLFRPDNPLLPNYKHIPIGYHGRASSVAVSGVPVRWPHGQRAGEQGPSFGPSQRLDLELELAIWVGPGNAHGQPIPISRAAAHIAGYGLLNDWSARDFQAWEYQPLGPFLAKSFHTTVSPYIITAEALAPFRCPQPPRPEGDPAPLPYLLDEADQRQGALSLRLESFLETARMRAAGLAPFRLSTGPATSLYWTPAQMLAHHASNGCPLHPGDLLGTGTISSPEPSGRGSLIEITEGGRHPLALPNGETRTFLQPGDAIVLTATAEAPGARTIGFGEARAELIA